MEEILLATRVGGELAKRWQAHTEKLEKRGLNTSMAIELRKAVETYLNSIEQQTSDQKLG